MTGIPLPPFNLNPNQWIEVTAPGTLVTYQCRDTEYHIVITSVGEFGHEVVVQVGIDANSTYLFGVALYPTPDTRFNLLQRVLRYVWLHRGEHALPRDGMIGEEYWEQIPGAGVEVNRYEQFGR